MFSILYLSRYTYFRAGNPFTTPAEPVLPGLALPEAFDSLDKRIESTAQFCRLKGSVESQILGLVTVCQEMQRLLKFAFIGE